MTDNVNHPAHYTAAGIECIDAIRAALTAEEFRGYCKGNVIKYIWREQLKGGNEDLQKASWYLAKATASDVIGTLTEQVAKSLGCTERGADGVWRQPKVEPVETVDDVRDWVDSTDWNKKYLVVGATVQLVIDRTEKAVRAEYER